MDGHHRLKACKELGITPRFEITHQFDGDKLSEKEFVIEINLKQIYEKLYGWVKDGERTDLTVPTVGTVEKYSQEKFAIPP